MTSQTPTPETTPCGGCGESNPLKRCIGCFHDFGVSDGAVSRNAELEARDQ